MCNFKYNLIAKIQFKHPNHQLLQRIYSCMANNASIVRYTADYCNKHNYKRCIWFFNYTTISHAVRFLATTMTLTAARVNQNCGRNVRGHYYPPTTVADTTIICMHKQCSAIKSATLRAEGLPNWLAIVGAWVWQCYYETQRYVVMQMRNDN